MNKTVFSNFEPAKITDSDLNTVWFNSFKNADEVLIATGYISNDAINELLQTLENNRGIVRKIDLFVGMHYLEGFTKPQYDSLIRLNDFLENNERGTVYVSQQMKFHGKLYSFQKATETTAMIGSANLSSFWKNLERTYETMLHISEDSLAKGIRSNIIEIIKNLGTSLKKIETITEFKSYNVNLDNHLNVETVDSGTVSRLLAEKPNLTFNIPIKPTLKSNLNVFFGKGRKDDRGFIAPRSWYEVEIIVPKKITSTEGFPYEKDFYVITNDGWKFKCKTSGTNSKNFRSENDLKILGKWLKGKLEQHGALKTGTLVTQNTLDQYGRDFIELRSTNIPNTWMLIF